MVVLPSKPVKQGRFPHIYNMEGAPTDIELPISSPKKGAMIILPSTNRIGLVYVGLSISPTLNN